MYHSFAIEVSYSSNGNTITKNTFLYNIYGIELVQSQHNTISENILSNNYRGVALRVSSNNTIMQNTINAITYYGIELVAYSSLYSDYDNIITGNRITHSVLYGISSGYTYRNRIYNNFFNNTHNAKDQGTNIWNITKTSGTNIIGGPYFGGNSWSDYTGSDTNSDGLGETNLPYTSNGGIQNGGDDLPL